MTQATPRTPRPTTRGERISYYAYTTAARLVCVLPERVAYALARMLGGTLYQTMPGRRRMAERHQQRITGATGPALERQVRGVFRSYARYWCEFFRVPAEAKLSPAMLESRFRVEGFEYIVDGIADGKGVILALPHVGGWEFAGAWLANRGYPPTVVAERVRPPELFDFFVKQRTDLGMEVVALGSNAGDAILAALRENKVVCLLADRDIKRDGVPVTFFGEETTMPPGPAAMALRTGATLVPVAVYFDGKYGHFGKIGPPIDVRRDGRLRDDVDRITQELAERFETLILAAPDEWHVLQPNWPSDREGAPIPGGADDRVGG